MKIDKPTKLFLFACIAALALHVATMKLCPLPWMDEVHIVEMGRLLLDGNSMSETILTQSDGSAFLPVYYLGPCLQEFCFRAGGFAGVRLSPMIGLLIATMLFYFWLRLDRKMSSADAALLAAVVLTMPLFVQSTRQVRVDTWCMSCAFAVFLLVDVPAGARFRFARLCLSGVIVALSPFVWPSSVFFIPLYIWIYMFCARANGFSRKAVLRDLLIVGMTVCLAGVVLMLPVVPTLRSMIKSLFGYFHMYGGHHVDIEKSFASIVIDILKGPCVLAVKETLRAPFVFAVFAMAMVGAGMRHRMLAVLFALALCFGMASGLHAYRFIYLLPYLIVAVVLLVQETKWRRTVHVLLFAAVAYGIFTGFLAYGVAAVVHAKDRDPVAFRKALAEGVGRGARRVYSGSYEIYYVARELGWTQLAYSDPDPYVDDMSRANLIAKADAVLLNHKKPFSAVEETYTLLGVVRGWALQAARKEAQRDTKSILATIGTAFSSGLEDECKLNLLRDACQRQGKSLISQVPVPEDYEPITVYARESCRSL